MPGYEEAASGFGGWSNESVAAVKDIGVANQSKPTYSLSGAPYNTVFDNSGWVVNTGSGTASNSQSKSAAGQALQLLTNPYVLAALVIGAALYLRR